MRESPISLLAGLSLEELQAVNHVMIGLVLEPKYKRLDWLWREEAKYLEMAARGGCDWPIPISVKGALRWARSMGKESDELWGEIMETEKLAEAPL